MPFTRSLLIAGLTLSTLTTFTSTLVNADPPKRVIRLSSIEGDASFLPAGEEEWVMAVLNRPMITGDALWNDLKTQSALQMGNATLCLGEQSSLSILNLDDQTTQVKLSEGTLNIQVRSLPNNQVYEIDTPNLAFLVTQPGNYRIAVDAQDDSTTVDVRDGKGDAYGENNAYEMDANQAYRFTGTDLQDYEELELAPSDYLDDWCSHQLPKAQTNNYVSTEVIGYEDLDRYGRWEEVEDYGHVWQPSEMSDDWAPYSDGNWAWIEPWGWTWVGEEAWGFAPYHYGRWVSIHDSWYWVPGPVSEYPVYAPALVAFLGGDGFELVIGGGADIAWFPLGPGDIYWPSYTYSQNYFSSINISAPLISAVLIGQAYKNHGLKLPYHNRHARNAITAVPNKVFIGGERVGKARVKAAGDKLAKAPVTQTNALKHGKESILGTTQKAKSKPTEKITSRRVIAKSKVETQKGKQSTDILSTKAGKPQRLPKGKMKSEVTDGGSSKDTRAIKPSKADQTPLNEKGQATDKGLRPIKPSKADQTPLNEKGESSKDLRKRRSKSEQTPLKEIDQSKDQRSPRGKQENLPQGETSQQIKGKRQQQLDQREKSKQQQGVQEQLQQQEKQLKRQQQQGAQEQLRQQERNQQQGAQEQLRQQEKQLRRQQQQERQQQQGAQEQLRQQERKQQQGAQEQLQQQEKQLKRQQQQGAQEQLRQQERKQQQGAQEQQQLQEKQLRRQQQQQERQQQQGAQEQLQRQQGQQQQQREQIQQRQQERQQQPQQQQQRQEIQQQRQQVQQQRQEIKQQIQQQQAPAAVPDEEKSKRHNRQ